MKMSEKTVVENKKPILMAIWLLSKMHFTVDSVSNTDSYVITDSDGKRIFGYGYHISEQAVIAFAERAYRFKRRNGLKKLKEEIPAMVEQIKSNYWISG